MCAQETTLTLLVAFFVTMVGWGLLGCLVLELLQPEVPAGADGFLLRGWRAMSWTALGLVAVQALGAVIGLALIFRAYLMAEAPFLAVFEYAMLITGGFWGWVIWGQTQNALAFVGIALIIVSGGTLARAGRVPPATRTAELAP
jgi:drug/metabolite transporter (DMT)-like permease